MKRKPWKPRRPLNPARYIDTNRMKTVNIHEGAKDYKPKFPKPGKKIKIDDPNSANWERKANHAWWQYINKTQNGCQVGGPDCKGPSATHHLIRKAVKIFKFHPENGLVLCLHHHTDSRECSPHAGPVGFTEFLQENLPDKAYWIIENQHKTGKPNFKADYQKLNKLLEEL